MGRATQSRLINLKESDQISSVAKVEIDASEEENNLSDENQVQQDANNTDE